MILLSRLGVLWLLSLGCGLAYGLAARELYTVTAGGVSHKRYRRGVFFALTRNQDLQLVHVQFLVLRHGFVPPSIMIHWFLYFAGGFRSPVSPFDTQEGEGMAAEKQKSPKNFFHAHGNALRSI